MQLNRALSIASILAIVLAFVACDTVSENQPTAEVEQQPEVDAPADTSGKGITAPDPPEADILSPASSGTYTIIDGDGVTSVNLQASVTNLREDARAIAYFCEAGANCPGESDPDLFFPPYGSGDQIPSGVEDYEFYYNQPSWGFGISYTPGGSFDFGSFGLSDAPDVNSPAPFGDRSDFQNISESVSLNGYGTYKFRVHTRNYRQTCVFGQCIVTKKSDNEAVTIRVRPPSVYISGPGVLISGYPGTYNANVSLPDNVEVASAQWSNGDTGLTTTTGTPGTLTVTVTGTDGRTLTATKEILLNDQGCGTQIDCEGGGTQF